MKKYFVLLIVLSLLLCGCGKNQSAPETGPIETAGPTEYVQETVLEPEITGPEAIMDPEDITEPVETEEVTLLARSYVYDERGRELLYREFSYDDYGRQTECWEYSDGSLVSFFTAVWTADNISEGTYSYYEEGTVIREVYDDRGNLILEEEVVQGQIAQSTSYEYDQYGNLCTSENLDGDGAVIVLIYCEYTYDGEGNVLSRKEYVNGDLVSWMEMEYDSENREVSSVHYNADGSLNYTTSTAYEGNTETYINYDADGNTNLTQITVYDELGNVLSRETWQWGEMVSRVENVYQTFEIIAR